MVPNGGVPNVPNGGVPNDEVPNGGAGKKPHHPEITQVFVWHVSEPRIHNWLIL